MPTNRHSRLPRPPDTLSPKQAAELLRLTPNTLAKRAREGTIETVKMGRLNRYTASSVRAHIWADNPRAIAQKLVDRLEATVDANNEEIVKEARSGRRRD